MKVAATIEADRMLSGERKGVDGQDEDLLKYRPNPDSLASKTTQENEVLHILLICFHMTPYDSFAHFCSIFKKFKNCWFF